MKIYQSCRICKAVYYNKAWHHGSHINIETVKKSRFSWTTRCPACKLVESGGFEGQITITHIPAMITRELLYLIKEYCSRAYEKNCQHRLIAVVKNNPHSWVVTTTNKQLAGRLGQKIGEAFDHVEVSPSYTDGFDSHVKVAVDFMPLFYQRFNFEALRS